MKNVINSQTVKELFSDSIDVQLRPIKINQSNVKTHIFAVDGLFNSELVDDAILKPFIYDPHLAKCRTEREVMDYLLDGGAYHVFVIEESDYDLMLQYVLSGMVAFIFDEEQKAIIYDVRTFDKRSVQEPQDEGVVKGSKDSFIEVMRTNTALIRRRVKSEHLVMELLTIGRLSKTDMTLAYISNVADLNLVKKIKDKLNNIDIDNISTPAFIEEYIIENKSSIFPQIMYTQRPDRVAANLTDGRIVLIVDGLPFVYIIPCQLPMLMQSPEDYANHYFVGSFLRIVRYISMILTLFLPALYIAATTYQSQMLPVELALSVQKAKLNVPFSSAAEVLAMLIIFEILIEAGLRLPEAVGAPMSILGGIVVGQSAVSANLLSPAVVVVVSLAGIAGFVIPNHDLSNAIRILRTALAILAAFGGFFGVAIGLIILTIHLCSLNNYGTAYLSPFVDVEKRDHKDTLFRFPIKFFTKRQKDIVPKNITKQKIKDK